MQRGLTAFESDSEYQEDELLRQELEMILLDDIENNSQDSFFQH